MKRISLFAFPAACLALMVGIVACGGKKTNPQPVIPSVEETVRAIREAQTPSQGIFAVNQMLANIGLASTAEYQSYTDEEEADIEAFFGEAIASENNSPNETTYAEAVEDLNTEFETSVPAQTVFDQLNADLASAPNDPTTPARNELLLLLELEGGGAASDKHITPAGAFLVAQWFAERFAPDEQPLVRSACTDACRNTFRRTLKRIHRVTKAILAAARTARRNREINQQRYQRIRTRVLARRAVLIAQARQQYDTCVSNCSHQQ